MLEALMLTSRKVKIFITTVAAMVGAIVAGGYFDIAQDVVNQLMALIAGLGGILMGAHAYTDAKVTKKNMEIGSIEKRAGADFAHNEIITQFLREFLPQLMKALSRRSSQRDGISTGCDTPPSEE